jgi:hypothetical protein
VQAPRYGPTSGGRIHDVRMTIQARLIVAGDINCRDQKCAEEMDAPYHVPPIAGCEVISRRPSIRSAHTGGGRFGIWFRQSSGFRRGRGWALRRSVRTRFGCFGRPQRRWKPPRTIASSARARRRFRNHVQRFAIHVLLRSVRNRKEFGLSVGQRRLADLAHSVGRAKIGSATALKRLPISAEMRT